MHLTPFSEVEQETIETVVNTVHLREKHFISQEYRDFGFFAYAFRSIWAYHCAWLDTWETSEALGLA